MNAALPPDADTVAPRKSRDALGRLCFFLHLAIMLFIIGGWALPSRGGLLFYLCFLPLVALQWQLNRNSCVLNNLESLMRTRRWRDAANEEEGAWFLNLTRNLLGLEVRAAHMDIFIYAMLLLFWGLALARFLRFPAS
ncbi:MAG TPA: hypothetical protein VGI20_14555 [Rhizomicrobium sp.]